MTATTILLFDLGGVLIENNVFIDLSKLLLEPIDGPTLQRRWLESPAVRDFERGYTTPDVFAAAFIEEWNLDLSAVDFIELFAGWLRGPFPGAVDFLDDLRKRYTVAYLSNSNCLHWERLKPVLDYADHAFSSHLYGIVKPEIEIFERVIRDLTVSAEQIHFFDDSIQNVIAARESGMRAHHTVGFSALKKAMSELGADRLEFQWHGCP